MGSALGCTTIHETPWLCPDAPAEKAWQDLQRLGKNSDSVLVVTHHPLINELLKRACGDADSHFEHAGIADALYEEFVSPLLHVLPMCPAYNCSSATALSCFHVFALQSPGVKLADGMYICGDWVD